MNSMQKNKGFDWEGMNQRPWRLLHRIEDGQRVWVYEPLWGKELTRLMKQGWKLVQQ